MARQLSNRGCLFDLGLRVYLLEAYFPKLKCGVSIDDGGNGYIIDGERLPSVDMDVDAHHR